MITDFWVAKPFEECIKQMRLILMNEFWEASGNGVLINENGLFFWSFFVYMKDIANGLVQQLQSSHRKMG